MSRNLRELYSVTVVLQTKKYSICFFKNNCIIFMLVTDKSNFNLEITLLMYSNYYMQAQSYIKNKLIYKNTIVVVIVI